IPQLYPLSLHDALPISMGGGIAQVLVGHGSAVLLRDVSRELLDRAAERISRGLAHEVEKARLSDADRKQALGRLRITIDWTELRSEEHTSELQSLRHLV